MSDTEEKSVKMSNLANFKKKLQDLDEQPILAQGVPFYIHRKLASFGHGGVIYWGGYALAESLCRQACVNPPWKLL